MVRVIRMFRPLVIYSRFGGTPADGHGQHQMAGYLTPLAFKAAADPNEFPEQLQEGLRPWQAKKLYRGVRSTRRRPPTMQVQTGVFDPALGRTYAEIAAEGRSQHKSQEIRARIEPLGPLASALRALDSASCSVREAGAVDLRRPRRLAAGTGDARRPARRIAARRACGHRCRREEGAARLSSRSIRRRIVPSLAEGLKAARAARRRCRRSTLRPLRRADADFLLAFKERDFTEALIRAAGVVVDPLADSETVESRAARST